MTDEKQVSVFEFEKVRALLAEIVTNVDIVNVSERKIRHLHASVGELTRGYRTKIHQFVSIISKLLVDEVNGIDWKYADDTIGKIRELIIRNSSFDAAETAYIGTMFDEVASFYTPGLDYFELPCTMLEDITVCGVEYYDGGFGYVITVTLGSFDNGVVDVLTTTLNKLEAVDELFKKVSEELKKSK